MFDLNRTFKLVAGALFDREATWRSYLPEAGNWQKTVMLLTGPLIVASAVIAWLLGLITADSMFRPTLLSTVGAIILGAIGIGVLSFIVSFLSGTFGGKSDFPLALAAATLAFVPGYVGQALVWLPWIGWLLGLGLGIFSLVQLWKIIPVYLEVPDNKRAMHFGLSLVVTIIAMAIIGSIFAPIMPGPNADPRFGSIASPESSSGRPGGFFENIERQAAIIAEAEEDTYTPPADGKVTERQVESYVSIMREVIAKRDASLERLETLAEEREADENLSASDIGSMMAGMSEFGALGTVEMETVKAAGANWAEHRWVKESLWEARLQREGSDAIEHNHALYERYAGELEEYADF